MHGYGMEFDYDHITAVLFSFGKEMLGYSFCNIKSSFYTNLLTRVQSCEKIRECLE